MNERTIFLGTNSFSYLGRAYGITWDVQKDNHELRLYLDIFNKRLKVLDYQGDSGSIARSLVHIAQKNNVGKILFYARECWDEFFEHGFVKEGEIDGYFNGKTAYCLSRFMNDKRMESPFLDEEKEIMEKVLSVSPAKSTGKLLDDWTIISGREEHASQLAELYNNTFETYPTPLNNEDYVKQVINDNVNFLMVMDEERVVSSASAERNLKYNNAEMTDCATRPDYRGSGLMRFLLAKLEELMVKEELITIYSLARARSVGMNMVFRKLGYSFTGRFINNCDICGGFEDMNLWVKRLRY